MKAQFATGDPGGGGGVFPLGLRSAHMHGRAKPRSYRDGLDRQQVDAI